MVISKNIKFYKVFETFLTNFFAFLHLLLTYINLDGWIDEHTYMLEISAPKAPCIGRISHCCHPQVFMQFGGKIKTISAAKVYKTAQELKNKK